MTTAKPVLAATCVERPPLYKDHSKIPEIRSLCNNPPVCSSHLPIKAKNLWPKGDRYRQVSLYIR